MLSHRRVHVEDTSQTVHSTWRVLSGVAKDEQGIVASPYISVDYIDVAHLLSEDLVLAKAFLGRLEDKHSVGLHEIRSNLKVETLSLVETEVVSVHLKCCAAEGSLSDRVANQGIIVIRLLLVISNQLSVFSKSEWPLVGLAFCEALVVMLVIILLHKLPICH